MLDGEVWRLVTFLFDPPATNPSLRSFSGICSILCGTTLEAKLGRVSLQRIPGDRLPGVGGHGVRGVLRASAARTFRQTTVSCTARCFWRSRRLYPDFVMYIFFVLPVRFAGWRCFSGCVYGMSSVDGTTWMMRGMVVASVLNYLLFFGSDIWRDMKQGHRRMQYQARTIRSPQRLVHTCARVRADERRRPANAISLLLEVRRRALLLPGALAQPRTCCASRSGSGWRVDGVG